MSIPTETTWTSARAPGTPIAGGRETQAQIVARVLTEQERLNPDPVYTERSKRRLRRCLPLCLPVAFLATWALSRLTGWTPVEWVGFAIGLTVALAYLLYLLVAERDDGRINRYASTLGERGEARDRQPAR